MKDQPSFIQVKHLNDGIIHGEIKKTQVT